MATSNVGPDNSQQLESWRHALKNVHRTLEMWALQQKKMDANIVSLSLGLDHDLVYSYGSLLLPSVGAVKAMEGLITYLLNFQADMANQSIDYLTRPLANYNPRPHTVSNKMAIIIREQAVASGFDDDSDDEETSVEVKSGQKKKNRLSLPLIGVTRWLAHRYAVQKEGGEVQPATQGKGDKGSKMKSLASVVVSAARIDTLTRTPSQGPRGRTQRKFDAALASQVRNSNLPISSPMPIAQLDRPEEVIQLRDGTELNLHDQAQSQCPVILQDITRMRPYNRNREFALAAAEVILFHLPSMIFNGHTGPSLLGEGQYTADPSDVARFFPQIQEILIDNMMQRKMSKTDPVVASLSQLMGDRRRRIENHRREIAGQQVLQFQPIFQTPQVIKWCEDKEMEPNMTNYSYACGDPGAGARSGYMTPRQAPTISSACSLMQCFVLQRSAMLEQISERMAYLTRSRPAITQPAPAQSSPYVQYIGIMLFLHSCIDKLTVLVEDMEGLLKRLDIVTNKVTTVTVPGLNFPDMGPSNRLGIRASIATEFELGSDCCSEDDDVRAVYDENIPSESPLAKASNSGEETIQLVYLVDYSNHQNLNYDRIGGRLANRMSTILRDAGTLPLPPSTPENVYV